MLILRRFLVIVGLMFWQGGFFFYGSVVVPVGTEVFAQHYPSDAGFTGKRQQGRITRTVGFWLNVAATIALIPMGWDVFASKETGRWRRWRGLLWIVTAFLLAILVWLYAQMDGQFNRNTLQITDESQFLIRHRVYLWLNAIQWGCCLLFLLLTLRTWREEDANTGQ
jgi:hypothetical protein